MASAPKKPATSFGKTVAASQVTSHRLPRHALLGLGRFGVHDFFGLHRRFASFNLVRHLDELRRNSHRIGNHSDMGRAVPTHLGRVAINLNDGGVGPNLLAIRRPEIPIDTKCKDHLGLGHRTGTLERPEQRMGQMGESRELCY